jgi:hypothetical protein
MPGIDLPVRKSLPVEEQELLIVIGSSRTQINLRPAPRDAPAGNCRPETALPPAKMAEASSVTFLRARRGRRATGALALVSPTATALLVSPGDRVCHDVIARKDNGSRSGSGGLGLQKGDLRSPSGGSMCRATSAKPVIHFRSPRIGSVLLNETVLAGSF